MGWLAWDRMTGLQERRDSQCPSGLLSGIWSRSSYRGRSSGPLGSPGRSGCFRGLCCGPGRQEPGAAQKPRAGRRYVIPSWRWSHRLTSTFLTDDSRKGVYTSSWAKKVQTPPFLENLSRQNLEKWLTLRGWFSWKPLSQACYQTLTLTESWNFHLNTQHGFFVAKQFRKEIQFNKFYISWLELSVLLMNHWEVHKCQERLLRLLYYHIWQIYIYLSPSISSWALVFFLPYYCS